MGGRARRRSPGPARRTPGLAAAVSTALAATVLAGCGGTDAAPAPAETTPTVSTGDKVCRTNWAQLAKRVRSEAAKGVNVRDAFADRWNSIEAGVDYYRQTATAQQCGELLRDRQTSVRQTAAVVAQGLPYDAVQRLQVATALRAAYRTLPGGTKEPGPVVAAYAELQKQTATAAEDLAPAYAELAAADPADRKAVAQAVSDVKLLAETSDAYVAADTALRRIDVWNASLRSKPAPKG